jgi:methylglutaconyl-CoA hydratase
MTAGAQPLIYAAADGVAWLTLNRPEKRNALSRELIVSLREGLSRAERDDAVRVVAVAAAGKDFCAGGDLAELASLATASVPENIADVEALERLILDLRSLPKPVVAVVQGRALAGGSGLATACDLIVARDDAIFGYPEVRIGFVPAMVMAILRRNLSEKRAFELIALGATFSAAEAERWGMVNRVFSAESFDEEVQSFLRTLAERSGSAVMLGKRLLYQQDGLAFDAAVRAGAAVNALARTTEETRKGVERFLDKATRPPNEDAR